MRRSLRTLRVERAERLVEQQHLRLHGERARERHALPLAARQLVGVAVGEAVQVDQLEQLVDAGLDLVLRALADAEPEGDVVPHGHVLERGVVLEHEADAALLGADRRRVLTPLIITLPASGTSSPAITRSSVDLPEPLGPSSAVRDPSGTESETSSSATKSSNRLLTFSAAIAMVPPRWSCACSGRSS